MLEMMPIVHLTLVLNQASCAVWESPDLKLQVMTCQNQK